MSEKVRNLLAARRGGQEWHVDIIQTNRGWRWRLYTRSGQLAASGPAVTQAGAEAVGTAMLMSLDRDVLTGAIMYALRLDGRGVSQSVKTGDMEANAMMEPGP